MCHMIGQTDREQVGGAGAGSSKPWRGLGFGPPFEGLGSGVLGPRYRVVRVQGGVRQGWQAERAPVYGAPKQRTTL